MKILTPIIQWRLFALMVVIAFLLLTPYAHASCSISTAKCTNNDGTISTNFGRDQEWHDQSDCSGQGYATLDALCTSKSMSVLRE